MRYRKRKADEGTERADKYARPPRRPFVEYGDADDPHGDRHRHHVYESGYRAVLGERKHEDHEKRDVDQTSESDRRRVLA